MKKSERRILAPAKINLFLKVDEKLASGYHAVRTLIVPLSLCDEITLTLNASAAVRLDCRLSAELERHLRACDELDRSLHELSSSANLAYRAAKIFLERVPAGPERPGGPETGVEIALVKRIPVQAGLGGGSSDAAAVLHTLWEELRPPGFSFEELLLLAAELGSDVPALLLCREHGGGALASGRGEKVRSVQFAPQTASALSRAGLVILKPPFGIPTATAYELLGKTATCEAENAGENPAHSLDTSRRVLTLGISAGAMSELWSREETQKLTIDKPDGSSGWHQASESVSGSVTDLFSALENDFEPVLFKKLPDLSSAADVLVRAGAGRCLLAGSGSSVAGIFGSADEAERAIGTVCALSPEESFICSVKLVLDKV